LEAVVIIPARLASQRFPGKVLVNDTGKYLIQHVYEQVRQASGVDRVVVAADDRRTVEACRSFGAEVVLTDPTLASGTDRVAAVAKDLDADIVINVQGDEPEIDPSCVEQLIGVLKEAPEVPMATLATPFGEEDDPTDPNCVKVVVGKDGTALYFSRSLIPYPRDSGGRVADPGRYLWHLGIYGYRRGFLLSLSQLPPSPLEQTERLEQLRALWHGYKIKVAVTTHRSCGIDTAEEYRAFVQRYLKAKGKDMNVEEADRGVGR